MKLSITGIFDAKTDSLKEAILRLSIRLKQMAHNDEPAMGKDGWDGKVEIVE